MRLRNAKINERVCPAAAQVPPVRPRVPAHRRHRLRHRLPVLRDEPAVLRNILRRHNLEPHPRLAADPAHLQGGRKAPGEAPLRREVHNRVVTRRGLRGAALCGGVLLRLALLPRADGHHHPAQVLVHDHRHDVAVLLRPSGDPPPIPVQDHLLVPDQLAAVLRHQRLHPALTRPDHDLHRVLPAPHPPVHAHRVPDDPEPAGDLLRAALPAHDNIPGAGDALRRLGRAGPVPRDLLPVVPELRVHARQPPAGEEAAAEGAGEQEVPARIHPDLLRVRHHHRVPGDAGVPRRVLPLLLPEGHLAGAPQDRQPVRGQHAELDRPGLLRADPVVRAAEGGRRAAARRPPWPDSQHAPQRHGEPEPARACAVRQYTITRRRRCSWR